MEDQFDRAQHIFDNAAGYLNELRNAAGNAPHDIENIIKEFDDIVREYGKLLTQLRKENRISDRASDESIAGKPDLVGKQRYDALTGINNRRFMEENLKRVAMAASRSGGMLSVLMIDIDFFKAYNDTYGRGIGDVCLKTVAGALSGCVTRYDDFVARYGGEEFIAVLPGTGDNGARHIAAKMLDCVRALCIPHAKNNVADCVTVSIGATAGYSDLNKSGGDYVARALKALNISKQNGRNRFTFLGIDSDD